MEANCRTLALADLPKPPLGRVGWPWTEASDPLPERRPDGSEWPRISLVTPSYNQGRFIEETIRSVLLQGYPNLEYIIIDGSSTDDSISIIKKYQPWLTDWVTEPDHGQSHAINKGFSRSTGEIMNWLCSDDILLRNTLTEVAKKFTDSPTVDVVVGVGRYIKIDRNHHIYFTKPSLEKINILECNFVISQPACFFKSSLLSRSYALDESLHFAMDHELYCYFKSRNAHWLCLDIVLTEAKEDGNNKSSNRNAQSLIESELIYKKYTNELIPLTFWYKWVRHPILLLSCAHPSRLVRLLSQPLNILLILVLSPFYGMKRVRAMGWPYINVWPY